MKAFIFACALGIVGASVAVACATTVVSGDAGGAGGHGVGGAGAAGRASGGGGSSATSQGTGATGPNCKVYDAGVGDAAGVWGCAEWFGLMPLSAKDCGKHGEYCPVCEAPAWCAWVGQFFECSDGCHWDGSGDVICLPEDPLPDRVCSFNHGWGPVPSDPNEYWEACGKGGCRQFPDGHYNCCGGWAPGTDDGKPWGLLCPCD